MYFNGRSNDRIGNPIERRIRLHLFVNVASRLLIHIFTP